MRSPARFPTSFGVIGNRQPRRPQLVTAKALPSEALLGPYDVYDELYKKVCTPSGSHALLDLCTLLALMRGASSGVAGRRPRTVRSMKFTYRL